MSRSCWIADDRLWEAAVAAPRSGAHPTAGALEESRKTLPPVSFELMLFSGSFSMVVNLTFYAIRSQAMTSAR